MHLNIITKKFYDYSLYIKGYSPYTIKRYRTVLTHYFKYARIENIDQATDENVRSLFYYGRTEKHWQPNTFIIYHVSLLVFFRWCVAQGYLHHNPVLRIEKPKLTKRLPV